LLLTQVFEVFHHLPTNCSGLIGLNAETRLSYPCSPSERRAKTTDPGHARGRGNAAAAPTPGHTAQKFGFLLESDPRETLPTFRKKEASFRYETKTRMARKKLRRPSLQQPGTKGLRANSNLKPYVTLVSRSQGRVRGQARADGGDDDDGGDAEEAEDRVFSNPGVGF